MSRREFPAKIKVAAFERSGGHCERCTAPLRVGRFAYDHVLPDALGGEPTLINCEVLCASCHGAKTFSGDVPRIAKMKRQRASHIGAQTRRSRPIPGSKASGWKQKLTGEWVKR
jgi:5-methylcytosine-specific restriction endonuclease McrA